MTSNSFFRFHFDSLLQNHVIASQILEKDDLVAKVQVLLDAERRDRAREAEIHAQEEAAYLEQQRIMREEFLRAEAEREHAREEAAARRSGESGHAAGTFGCTSRGECAILILGG